MSEGVLDILFPVAGSTVPLDHGYRLFSALSSVHPWVHERPEVALAPLEGPRVPGGLKPLALRVRAPSSALAQVAGLSDSEVILADARLRLGTPRLLRLEAAPALHARLVTFKAAKGSAMEEATFRACLARALARMECQGTPHLLQRRVLCISGVKVVGWEVRVEGLSAEDSLRLQVAGLGGRRHMGCGFFLPTPARSGQS